MLRRIIYSYTCYTIVFTLVSIQSAICQENEQRSQFRNGLEIVNPKELGLSDEDIAKYFGNVKQLQTLQLPSQGGKAQILTVGFDEQEKLNLQNFEHLPTTGLEGPDRNVAQRAFSQFQSIYGGGENNGSIDLDGLTTLFSKNPKLDVLESLNLIPPSSKESSFSSNDEEKRVNKQIQEQIDQEHKKNQKQSQEGQGQITFHHNPPFQVFQPNFIPNQPPFMHHPQFFQPQPQFFQPQPQFFQPQPQLMQFVPSPSPHPQQFIPFPQSPTPAPQQFVQLAPAPTVPAFVQQRPQQMPPILIPSQPALPRVPPQQPTLAPQHQLISVRPVSRPPFMQIPTAQPQYVHIRQKGEPQEQQQQQQFIQLASPPPPQTQFIQTQPQQYVLPQGQYLQQLQIRAPPIAGSNELNYAHQSHPMMIIQEPPVLGHTAFLDMYKDNSQEEKSRLKDLNFPNTVDLTSNSLKEGGAEATFFLGNTNNAHTNEQIPGVQVHYPQQYSTLYKQSPILVSRPLRQPSPSLPPQFLRTHYQGRHIANVRRPSMFEQGLRQGMKMRGFPTFDGPAFGTQPSFGTQPAFVFPGRGVSSKPISPFGPNQYMMPPRPSKPNYVKLTPSSKEPPSFSNFNGNLLSSSQQVFQSILPFDPSSRNGRQEPTPSMPLIKISKPENAMRRPNKFLEEMVHAFENKFS